MEQNNHNTTTALGFKPFLRSVCVTAAWCRVLPPSFFPLLLLLLLLLNAVRHTSHTTYAKFISSSLLMSAIFLIHSNCGSFIQANKTVRAALLCGKHHTITTPCAEGDRGEIINNSSPTHKRGRERKKKKKKGDRSRWSIVSVYVALRSITLGARLVSLVADRSLQ